MTSHGSLTSGLRLERSRELLCDCQMTELSPQARMVWAFEAAYFCCVEIAAARGVNVACEKHPSREIIDAASSALALSPAKVRLMQELRDWCQYAAPIRPAPRMMERAVALADDVYRRTVELLASMQSDG
ncbi:hypothetical protein PQR75_42365 [Paraburkholderia fungorum]|uniref:hypothetical protein n=1 Tax=Paraburkholderia fungorum TaxID=134537 RepID=UPI0038B805D8